MITYSIEKAPDGAVFVFCNSLLGKHPIMWFSTWDLFMAFYNDMAEVVEANEPQIPDVFKDAFNEGWG